MHRTAMDGTRYSFEAHTSELCLRVEAPDLAGLFTAAGRALAEVMGGTEPVGAASGPAEEVRLAAPDRDALLVDWLNELIYLAEVRRRLYTDIRIDDIDDRSLRATVRGVPAPDLRGEVKAATFHGLHIDAGPEGLAAAVVLDV